MAKSLPPSKLKEELKYTPKRILKLGEAEIPTNAQLIVIVVFDFIISPI